MLKHIILLSSLFALLTACGGGGGGGGGSQNSTPPPSTQTSSSSVASIDPCNNTGGTIFSECVNANYGFVVGAEYLPTYVEYTETNATKHVQWSVTDTGSIHNNVLDVRFLDNTKRGNFYIGHPGSDNPATQDLSQFKTGTLSFDIRVISFGDSYDASAGGAVFAARTDCVWPCNSHEIPFVVPTLDTWKHVDISIADMIASGLDISKINISFILTPRSVTQKGLRIQVDNVQLAKGGATASEPKVIYKEDFNSKDYATKWLFSNYLGRANFNLSTSFGASLWINWMNTNDTVRFETTLDKTIDITNKKASFQLNCWFSSTDNFTYQMIATDTNGTTAGTTANYAMGMQKDTWYQISANLGNDFDKGFNAKGVKKIGLQFVYLGGFQTSTQCMVDTIRITE